MKTPFDKRSADIEIMDDLSCSGQVVLQTLRELDTINKLLGGNSVTLGGLKILLSSCKQRNLSIADLGCGGGDMLRRIKIWGEKRLFNFSLTGIDANANIISFAEENTPPESGIRFLKCDVFSPEFGQQHFDVVIATLFMHHFNDDQLTDLFRVLNRNTTTGIIINDIHRHWFAFYSIRYLTKFFSRSAMVRFDAPLSVLRAFRRKELESILDRAGIDQYSLRWRWAFRWQLIIRPGLQR